VFPYFFFVSCFFSLLSFCCSCFCLLFSVIFFSSLSLFLESRVRARTFFSFDGTYLFPSPCLISLFFCIISLSVTVLFFVFFSFYSSSCFHFSLLYYALFVLSLSSATFYLILCLLFLILFLPNFMRTVYLLSPFIFTPCFPFLPRSFFNHYFLFVSVSFLP
jgi:hypothetical protein